MSGPPETPGKHDNPPQTRPLLSGAKFDVAMATLTARDGSTREREVVLHPGSVVLLPLLSAREIVLIRNHRFPVGRELLELPAGTLEAGEDPAACAGRELEEETGYRAGTIEHAMSFLAVPGWCTERMHAYIARDLEHVGQKLEPTESIKVETCALDDALAWVRDGTIEDAKTIAVLLYYVTFCV